MAKKKKKKSTKGKKVVKKSTAKKTTSSSAGKETGRWNGHKFTVSSSVIRGFDDLQIKGSCELASKKKSKQGYAKRKSGNPTEITLTVILNAYAGCDVRKEALAFVAEARDGKQDYFYAGGKKLVSCKLMLTAVNVKETEISPKGTWINAKVTLTMKQSSKGSASSSTSGSKKKKSKKASVKSSSPTQSYGGGSYYSSSGSGTTSKKTYSKTTTPIGTLERIASRKPTAASSYTPKIKQASKVASMAKRYTIKKK